MLIKRDVNPILQLLTFYPDFCVKTLFWKTFECCRQQQSLARKIGSSVLKLTPCFFYSSRETRRSRCWSCTHLLLKLPDLGIFSETKWTLSKNRSLQYLQTVSQMVILLPKSRQKRPKILRVFFFYILYSVGAAGHCCRKHTRW